MTVEAFAGFVIMIAAGGVLIGIIRHGNKGKQ